jgi:hypothetical protein
VRAVPRKSKIALAEFSLTAHGVNLHLAGILFAIFLLFWYTFKDYTPEFNYAVSVPEFRVIP